MEANSARVFGETARVPRDLTTPAGIAAYAEGMEEIVGRTIVLTDRPRIPKRDLDVVQRLRAELESAQAVLARRAGGMSVDDVGQFEEHLRRATAELVAYGAEGCLPPPRLSSPEPPLPGAGTHVDICRPPR